MKLLRDFFRRRMACFRGVSGRGVDASREFAVTVPVPAPLTASAETVVLVDLPVATPAVVPVARREPASFLKAPRHRRLGSGR